MHTTSIKSSDTFGRIINHVAFDRLKQIVDDSKADIYFGGDTDREEKYIAPTILDYGTDAARFDASPAMQD
jgi:aldehyde dehydrogenase (NAD+)